MRKFTYSLILSLSFLIQGSSQDLRYAVRGAYTSPVTKEKLSTAKIMSDFRPGYPATWISDYISTEISSTVNGKLTTAAGINDTLNEAQRNILQKAEVGDEIIVNVRYKYSNLVIDHMDIHTMNFVVTVVPDIEAEYPGGKAELSNYIEKNVIHQVSTEQSKENMSALIRFTVSETGEITKAHVSRSSENTRIDNLLLKAINQMPKWKPAENLNGVKIRQEFQFAFGNAGC